MKTMFRCIILLTLLSLTAFSVPPADSADAYRNSIDQWHAGRINGLKRDHGWLSLIALDWIKEGPNTIAGLGSFELRGDSVRVMLDDNLSDTQKPLPFRQGIVHPDQEKIVVGTRAFMVIKRGGKFAVRIWDSAAPNRTGFAGIERYPVDSSWRVTARWEAYTAPRTVDIPTAVSGLVQQGVVPGVAVFTIAGVEYRLEPTIEDGSDELFFVFGDRTNGRETYGAGRFLYSPMPKEGKVMLDFNRSYNPPCVFSDFATCPVPFPQNKLKLRITAGEKKYSNH